MYKISNEHFVTMTKLALTLALYVLYSLTATMEEVLHMKAVWQITQQIYEIYVKR